MKIDIVTKHFDQVKKDWEVNTKIWDTGVTFADLFFSPCDIDQHIPRRIEDAQKYDLYECRRCKYYLYKSKYYIYNSNDARYPLDAPVEYNIWHPHTCYECEEQCIISKPLDKIISCNVCGGSGLLQGGKDNVLEFFCEVCNNEQIIQ